MHVNVQTTHALPFSDGLFHIVEIRGTLFYVRNLNIC